MTNIDNEILEEIKPECPWIPGDKREFWCEKLDSFVKLSPDLDSYGNYWVIKVGEGNFRRWPVKGSEIIPKDQAPVKDKQTSEFLNINNASWTEIKTLLCNQFITSYPWNKKGDKNPQQIREEMLNLAKSRKNGIATAIEDERKAARFEDRETFIIRMNAVYESFPWNDFSQLLEF